MTRKYELRRRAEQMAATRRRIVEAAVELHESVGPARTSVSAIAERAGVQRQTYYRHFPDQRSLFRSCSGLYMERHPLPAADRWLEIADPEQRLIRGLEELYAYYADNEPMLASVARDAEVDELTREMVDVFVAPALEHIREALAAGFENVADRSLLTIALDLALDFGTWRLLVRRNGLSHHAAARMAAATALCLERAGETPGSPGSP